MQGLKVYGYNDEMIDNIVNNIDEQHRNYILTHEDKVLDIIEYLKSKGIDAISLLEVREDFFYNSLEKIKNQIENNLHLLDAIKEDYACFDLIDL